jgi:hypothetical protein
MVSASIDDLSTYWDEDLDWSEESGDLAQVLRGALSEDYSDAGDEEMGEALDAILDVMSPAESFGFTSALRQIQQGAGQVLSNPMVNQFARTALPVGAGMLGTVIGGPVGTAVGSKLGAVAANALPGRRPVIPTASPAATGGLPAMAAPGAVAPAVPGAGGVAGGSAAAAQGLVLAQRPDVLQALLALAMGQHGQKSVNGIPVAGVMNMLSSVFGQAAADADELLYLDRDDAEDGESDGGEELLDYAGLPSDRALYTALVDADNYELSEALL